jgi:hypothetical protein
LLIISDDAKKYQQTLIVVVRDTNLVATLRSANKDQGKSTSNSLDKRYGVILIVIQLMNSQRRSAPRGDANHPNVGRINSQRITKRRSYEG